MLLNGAKEVKLFGETIEVQAKIENLPGISGHADVNQLTKWVSMFDPKPKRVFIVHGEDKVTEQFAAHIHEELGLDAYAPFRRDRLRKQFFRVLMPPETTHHGQKHTGNAQAENAEDHMPVRGPQQ